MKLRLLEAYGRARRDDLEVDAGHAEQRLHMSAKCALLGQFRYAIEQREIAGGNTMRARFPRLCRINVVVKGARKRSTRRKVNMARRKVMMERRRWLIMLQ